MKNETALKHSDVNENERNNSVELNDNNTTVSSDKFDWDFILEREWSRTKK
ncbi:MAG: hypothetical protein ACFE9R_01895 [Candidatus Hermodarchaeota archaeon]